MARCVVAVVFLAYINENCMLASGIESGVGRAFVYRIALLVCNSITCTPRAFLPRATS